VSIQGTLGPLVQGPSSSRIARAGIAAVFVAAFAIGALGIFAIVGAVGTAVGVTRVPLEWRVGLAGLALLPLAAVDLRAMAKATYCPIGWRRQTPRVLMRRYPMMVAASVWGLDTGLVVTTFRVAAVSWGALLLAALDLAPRWAGLGYGLGFTLPFLLLLARPGLGRAARAVGPADPGLEALLRKRSVIQSLSAAVLLATAGLLLGRLVA
jgi:hypothetical protein